MSYKGGKKSNVYCSRDGYDKYAPFYDQSIPFLNTFEQGYLFEFLQDIKGKMVLDLGCGTGRLTKPLLIEGANVCGVDISKGMLKIARENYPRVEFKQGEAENIPYKDGSFDFVVATFLIVHLKNLEKTFSEVYRVLKDGGVFVLTNINQRHAPKLKAGENGEIVIESHYHRPKDVIDALSHNLFRIDRDELVNEKDVWVNQIIRAVK